MPLSDGHKGKPKLLVILGAGSSVACEMPRVSDIDKQMNIWSRKYRTSSPDQHEIDIFKELWDMVTCYYGTNHYGIRPNYEMVLGEMTALAGWVSPSPFGNPLIEVVKGSSITAPLTSLLDPSDPYRARKEIVRQQTFLLERLADYMRDESKNLNFQSDALSDYREFLRRLQDRFQLGVYNLNNQRIDNTYSEESRTAASQLTKSSARSSIRSSSSGNRPASSSRIPRAPRAFTYTCLG